MANNNDLTTIPKLGDFGSCYITGDGQKVDLTGASATAYVCAIYVMTAATQFQALENLNEEYRHAIEEEKQRDDRKKLRGDY